MGSFLLGDVVIEKSKLNMIEGVISPDQNFSTQLVSGILIDLKTMNLFMIISILLL